MNGRTSFSLEIKGQMCKLLLC